MAKDQDRKEWETASSEGFVLFYAYTGITRANEKGRQKAMVGIKSHLDIHLIQGSSIPIIP